MACNCGGGAAYPIPASTAIAVGAAVLPAAQAWDVTFPNGTTMRYYQQWKAHQAQALSGGTIREVGPDDNPGADTGDGQGDTPDPGHTTG
jgi:hypothetical protein